MRVFKTKWFVRFARREGITDTDLCAAVDRAVIGLIDADLGGGVIKQRIARPNEGKSGGFRAIVLFRSGEKAFFGDAALGKAIRAGALIEVKCDEEEE